MSTQQELKQKVVETPQLTPIDVMIKKQIAHLGEALPKHMNAERLVRIALTTMRLNPELYKCSPASIMGALFQSAQIGLEPNVEGQAYIIPFNNKRKDAQGNWHTIKEAQFQIGYKGYVELFYRHAAAISLDFQKVRQGDDFDFQYGTESYLRHKPAWDSAGEPTFYYAVAKLKSGGTLFKVMTRAECLEHGKTHSKCFSKKDNAFYPGTPWADDTDSMCLKTVLIQLMKLLPKSIELQKAIASDETIKTRIEPDMFEVNDEAHWNGDTVDVGAQTQPSPIQGVSKGNPESFSKKPSEVKENPDGSIAE